VNGRILVVGSLNADLVARVDRFPAPGETVLGRDFAVFAGGKGGNQACAAARLGGRVEMIGGVGDDVYGDLLTEGLRAAGVDVTGVRRHAAASSGVALITVDADGQNEIVVAPGANGLLATQDLEAQRGRFVGANVLLVQLEVPLAAVRVAMELGREAGAQVILDPAPVDRRAEALLPLADYVTPNESELAALTGSERIARSPDEAMSQARDLLVRGASRVVAKLGPRGALLVAKDREMAWPGIPVSTVDTTAAGDVWNGAFAASLAEGRSLDEAGLFANAAAALSVTRRGAQPAMPTRGQLDAWNETRESGRDE
jgi:ribokinase